MKTTSEAPKKPRKERKENADKRRRQILDATFRSIVANGLSKTTLATVANEAGLSQGVAVFYYKSKNGLLTAALEDLYQRYEHCWRAALEASEPSPEKRLMAILEADFDRQVCTPEILSIWFAFWGEQNFTPQYAEITKEFDRNRQEALTDICRQLLGNDSDMSPEDVSDWIDTLTDGYWQRMHLFPDSYTKETALKGAKAFLARVMPQHFS